MRVFFYLFLLYSLLGCALETLYGLLKTRRLQNRKTMLLLPLCPVYGVGALVIVLVTETVQKGLPFVAAAGILFGTAVEYLYALACERAFRVKLWEYAGAASIHGRVNPLFSAYWGALSLALVFFVQPMARRLAEIIPQGWFWPVFLVFMIDLTLTVRMLFRFGRRNGRLIGCPVVRKI